MTDNAYLEVDLPSEETTERFARAFAQSARPRFVVFLSGDLGAGKTAWVRACLRAWGWTGLVRSPTYTLHETYDTEAVGLIHHLDLYRLSAAEELAELGLADVWSVPAVWFIEWPERGSGHLPPPDLILHWRHSAAGRQVHGTPVSAAGKKTCAVWMAVFQQEGKTPTSHRIEKPDLSE